METTVKTPWYDEYIDMPVHLKYFEGSMYEAVEEIAKKYPDNIAFTFMGRHTTYKRLIAAGYPAAVAHDRRPQRRLCDDRHAELSAGSLHVLCSQPDRRSRKYDPPAVRGERDRTLSELLEECYGDHTGSVL